MGDFFVHLSLLFISSVFNQESDLGNLCSDGRVSKRTHCKVKDSLITCEQLLRGHGCIHWLLPLRLGLDRQEVGN